MDSTVPKLEDGVAAVKEEEEEEEKEEKKEDKEKEEGKEEEYMAEELAEEALIFDIKQAGIVDIARSMSLEETVETFEKAACKVIGSKSKSEPNIKPLKTGSPDPNESPPPFASFMIALPMRDNHVDQVTVGHQALADALALLLPLSGFPSSIVSADDLNTRTISFPPWNYKGEQKGIHIFSMPPEGTTNTVAGVTLLKHPVQSVWDVMKNSACRKAFDPMMKKYQLIEEINDYTRVIRVTFATRYCVVNLNREIVCTTSERVLSSGRFVAVSRSTQHPSCPVKPGVFRTNVSVLANLVEAVSTEPNYPLTRITTVVKVDLPKLPKSVLDYVMKQQPLLLANARDTFGW